MTSLFSTIIIITTTLIVTTGAIYILSRLRKRRQRVFGSNWLYIWDWPYFLYTLGSLFFSLGLGSLLLWWLRYGFQTHAFAYWILIFIVSMLGGVIPVSLTKRLSFAEEIVAMIFVSGFVWGFAYPVYADIGIAAVELRSLFIAPFVMGLLILVSAAITYLLTTGVALDKKWGLELMVGIKLLLAKRSKALSTVSSISLFGVALGVGLLIVSLAVLAGFERDMVNKIVGANAHITFTKQAGYRIHEPQKAMDVVKQHTQVVSQYPYVMGEVMLASDTNLTGAMLFGVNVGEARKVIEIFDNMAFGKAQCLNHENEASQPFSPLPGINVQPAAQPQIIVGSEMMRMLNIEIGDTVRVVSPMIEELTPAGPMPKTNSYRVCGIFDMQMYEYDAKFVYISLPDAQKFFELGNAVTGIGVRIDDMNGTQAVGEAILSQLGGYPFKFFDWKRKNEALFASVEVEKIVSFIVLIFIVLVASFSIVNTLTMSVIERGQAIALLKAMGARDLLVMKIFVIQGATIGFVGTLLGVAGGVILCMVLKHYGVWIDPEIYYIDRLPVYLSNMDVIQVTISSLLITFVAAVYPSRMAERFSPVEGLRDG